MIQIKNYFKKSSVRPFAFDMAGDEMSEVIDDDKLHDIKSSYGQRIKSDALPNHIKHKSLISKSEISFRKDPIAKNSLMSNDKANLLPQLKHKPLLQVQETVREIKTTTVTSSQINVKKSSISRSGHEENFKKRQSMNFNLSDKSMQNFLIDSNKINNKTPTNSTESTIKINNLGFINKMKDKNKSIKTATSTKNPLSELEILNALCANYNIPTLSLSSSSTSSSPSSTRKQKYLKQQQQMDFLDGDGSMSLSLDLPKEIHPSNVNVTIDEKGENLIIEALDSKKCLFMIALPKNSSFDDIEYRINKVESSSPKSLGEEEPVLDLEFALNIELPDDIDPSKLSVLLNQENILIGSSNIDLEENNILYAVNLPENTDFDRMEYSLEKCEPTSRYNSSLKNHNQFMPIGKHQRLHESLFSKIIPSLQTLNVY